MQLFTMTLQGWLPKYLKSSINIVTETFLVRSCSRAWGNTSRWSRLERSIERIRLTTAGKGTNEGFLCFQANNHHKVVGAALLTNTHTF